MWAESRDTVNEKYAIASQKLIRMWLGRRRHRSAKSGHYSRQTAAPHHQASRSPEGPLLFISPREPPNQTVWMTAGLLVSTMQGGPPEESRPCREEAADYQLVAFYCASLPEAELHLHMRCLFMENNNILEPRQLFCCGPVPLFDVSHFVGGYSGERNGKKDGGSSTDAFSSCFT